ncbi:MAG: hypothetical protein ACD_60C00043G0004 [uncultured bacterium]|nr:MAG: hypothetical protein ACD_60C00043G0004 [uncultured bacterium]
MIQEITYQHPVNIFYFFAKQSGAVFLESAQLMENCARYSFIAIDPFQTLIVEQGKIKLNDQWIFGDPLQILAEELAKFPEENKPNLPPFQGGAAGFLSYELARYIEKIPVPSNNDMQFRDMAVGFYDLVIGFDMVLERAWIFSNGYPEKERQKREKRAQKRLDWLLHCLVNKEMMPELPDCFCQAESIHSSFTKETYQDAVKKVINYILAGDIFEANISQRFHALLPKNADPFSLYRKLRALNPAPFAAYLNLADTVIASASPERFLKLTEGEVETRPIKGTRPRGKNVDEDKHFAKELCMSEKDRAENVMIVDLLRNDLSRVCVDHTVCVKTLCGLESYATVHHLVSVITGTLLKNKTAVDLLRATFPGGSITGAPKIRAMEIIAEIEPTPRGPYCGSIGYIGFNGDMDFSITIRTFAIKNNIITFQAGGAIVMDSDPLTEYEETLTKSKALRNALIH